MIVTQADDGTWTRIGGGHRLANTHPPTACEGRLCDIHDRRGPEPYASWPLNWRDDRAMFEVICPHGIGHPSPAQAGYWRSVDPGDFYTHSISHGCDGCCAGAYDRSEVTA